MGERDSGQHYVEQGKPRGVYTFGLSGESLHDPVTYREVPELRPSQTHSKGARDFEAVNREYNGGPSVADRMDS